MRSRRRRAEDMRMRRRRARGREMSLGFALAPVPQASAVAYGLGYAAALELTARRFSAALSSRAPGTRREKGFLIDRAEALRSTELAIRQVGWDGGTCLATTEPVGLWHRVWYGLRRYARWRGTMDPVHPSRARGWARGWAAGPKGRVASSIPRALVRAQRRWAEGVKVWYRFRVSLASTMAWYGREARRETERRAGEVGDGGNSRLVYVFPCVHMRHSTRR